MNELFEKTSSVSGDSLTVSGEAVSVSSDTETIEVSPDGSAATSGTLVAADPVGDTLATIATDVHLILVIVILSFAMSCMRGWRKNTLKGV